MQDVVAVRQPAAPEDQLGQQRDDDDGDDVAEHDGGPEGEELAADAIVERELQQSRQAQQRLAGQKAQQEGQEEAGQTAVAVGGLKPQDEGELREEDDVHEVGAEDEEAVDAVGSGSDDGGQNAADHDGCSQHPHQLPTGRLRWQMNTSGSRFGWPR